MDHSIVLGADPSPLTALLFSHIRVERAHLAPCHRAGSTPIIDRAIHRGPLPRSLPSRSSSYSEVLLRRVLRPSCGSTRYRWRLPRAFCQSTPAPGYRSADIDAARMVRSRRRPGSTTSRSPWRRDLGGDPYSRCPCPISIDAMSFFFRYETRYETYRSDCRALVVDFCSMWCRLYSFVERRRCCR
jgi:hypothetical protein